MATNYTYPYNPNGDIAECIIPDELHTITAAADRNYNWFIPFVGPFFADDNVVITHVASGKELREGIDYYYGLEYHSFNTRITLKPVYGAIVLIDKTLLGSIRITYMTMGGRYAINEQIALNLLANAQIDPRRTQWEKVYNTPTDYPVSRHLHSVDDIVTMGDVRDSIDRLTDVMRDSGAKWYQTLAEHTEDFDDPHRVLELIEAQIGAITLVKATQQVAEDGTNNESYMTSLRTTQQIAKNVLPLINSHRNDRNNPHGVTPSIIGAVPTSRTINGKPLTADIVLTLADLNAYSKNEVDALIKQHTDRTDNPHNVTPALIGAVPTNRTINGKPLTGNITITAADLSVYTQAQVDTLLRDHTSRTDNPHETTPAKIGAVPITRTINGKPLSADITITAADLGVYGIIEVDQKFVAYAARRDNPNQVNASQVGLGQVVNLPLGTEQIYTAGLNLSQYYPTLALVKFAIAQEIGNGGGSGDYVTMLQVNAAIDNALANIGRYPIANMGDVSSTDKLSTPATVNEQIRLSSPHNLLGVCVSESETTRYLAQTTIVDDCIDMVNRFVFVYNNGSWERDTIATPESKVLSNRYYFNRLTGKGFIADGPGSVVHVSDINPGVTKSANPPPALDRSYRDGHIWVQTTN